MGFYIYVNKEDVKRMKEIASDRGLDEVFQMALKYHKELLIEESYHYVRDKFWVINGKKKKCFTYTVYEEAKASDGSPYQARYVPFLTNVSRKELLIYLYGAIDGGYYTEYYLKPEGEKNEGSRVC